MGSKNELWEVKNQIGPENMNEEERHECLESENGKSKYASNVNGNITK